MRCPQCQGENEADAKFCEECGNVLARVCASCGRELKPKAKFCPACGSHVDTTPPEPIAAPAPPAPTLVSIPAPDGERRQLTVLFCDLVGSTDIASRLDPEEFSDIAAQYQRTAAEAVIRFGGHVAKYLGDGLVVYFGYPQAHDDDVERAVRGGLAILEAMTALNVRLESTHGLRLLVRVGAHTGLVVLTPGGGAEVEVFGEVPHVAARVQAVAAPDSVVITGVMHRLVAGIFVVEELGPHSLKGVPAPIQLYRVVQPSGVQSRLASGSHRLTPLVGREVEIGGLLARWEQVVEHAGQSVVISGEAGVGKSRLVCALRERLTEEPHTWLECRSGPYTQHSAFHPLIELVERGLTLNASDTPVEKIAKLEAGLEHARFPLAETVPLFAAFLSIPLTDTYVPLRMSPELQRKKTMAALVAWVLALGESQPVLLLVEDLHWCDPSSLDVLRDLIEQMQQSRVLLVCTTRPELSVPWPARSHLTLIQLHRLTKRQAREAVLALSPARALPEPVIEQIMARADGIPLYLEELMQGVLDSGLLQVCDGRYQLVGTLEARRRTSRC